MLLALPDSKVAVKAPFLYFPLRKGAFHAVLPAKNPSITQMLT